MSLVKTQNRKLPTGEPDSEIRQRYHGLLSQTYTTDSSQMELNNRRTPTEIPITNKTSSPQTQCHD